MEFIFYDEPNTVTDLPCSYTAKKYLMSDGIGNRFCTFVIKAEREQIIEVMRYVISYAAA